MVEMLSPLEALSPPLANVEWLQHRSNPGLQLSLALDEVRRAPSILEAIRLRANVVHVVRASVEDGVSSNDLLEPILEAIADPADSVTGLAATHALAAVPGDRADSDLARLIFDGEAGFEEHAVWAALGRRPSPWLVETVAGALSRGGVTGMHAQSALARWARSEPDMVLAALERRLLGEALESGRRYLTEAIGLVPGRPARLSLERLATDPDEPILIRTTAVAAFAERMTENVPASISALARMGGPLAEAVTRVRAQRALSRRGPIRGQERAEGIRVAQLHLGAVLDEDVSRAGSGDTGGVATLLSRLGPSLAAQPRVAEVVTIGRANPGARATSGKVREGHRFESVPLAPGEGGSFTSPWPSLVAAQRGIRAALLSRDLPDVLHLRMADPGSLAGALVARELGIATVFTMAPDPHVHVQARERSGELDRTDFVRADAREALWLRMDLVEHLATQAREVVLFPRPNLRQDLEDLVGVDIAAGPPRHTIVAEGIDAELADTAGRIVASAARPQVLDDLDAAIGKLPADRHGLPLVISVGRMHEVKGMARLVAAFAADVGLSARANLVIVGGELDSPSAAEAAELERIELVLRDTPEMRDRVVLLGRRSNDDVALLLSATHAGWGSRIGANGAYACGSRKEEFGLAIIEAMAAGLPVLAPIAGGPASYVQTGVTGVLVDTGSVAAIAGGMHRALDLAGDPGTADLTRRLVRDRFTLERMAQTLAALYRISTAASTLALPINEDSAA